MRGFGQHGSTFGDEACCDIPPLAHEGPGYFAKYLNWRNIPWRLIAVDQGDAVPADPQQLGGLVFMGGPMSVNDDLPWIPSVLRLIRQGIALGVPVLGHCLGGQLMSKALGGTVGRNPVKEIGWGEVLIADNPVARQWFGPGIERFESFHWHGETFTIPQGAVRIMGNRYCENQGFVIGNSLGMQCHVEMTEELVKSWCETGRTRSCKAAVRRFSRRKICSKGCRRNWRRCAASPAASTTNGSRR